MASPKTVLAGSKLNVVSSGALPSLNVAVTVIVLAIVSAAAPPIPLFRNVPMKMAMGLIGCPEGVEMTAGLVAGELGATAKLQGVTSQNTFSFHRRVLLWLGVKGKHMHLALG